MNTQSQLITIHAAANLLQITPLSVLRLIAHRKLPAVRMGHRYWLLEEDVLNHVSTSTSSINFLPPHQHQSTTTQQY